MARSKKRKNSKKPRRPAFFESVPMAVMPPAALPQVPEQLFDSVTAVANAFRKLRDSDWRGAWQKARHSVDWLVANVMWAGLATTNTVIDYSRRFGLASRFAAEATVAYAPPIFDDLRTYAKTTRRALASRRARALYLAIVAASSIALVVVGTTTAAAVISSYAKDISSPAALLSKKKTGTTILDRNGQVLFEGYGGQATKVIHLGDLPQSIKDATLAAEDPEFYNHPGFSWKGIARAAWVDISKRGTLEGGSTLTQQLVKNALLTSDRSFQRKYQELLLAYEVEHRYSKDEILEMYLNEIYYGQGSSGIEAAAQTYFHKPAHDLNLSESALLAGLPLGPSRFDPNASVTQATGRRDYVLTRMQQLGKITNAQATAAKAQPIRLAAAGAPDTAPGSTNAMTVYSKQVTLKAPHFVFYVLNQLRQKYGDDVVEQGGITVQTTLDLSKQKIAEDTVRAQIQRLGSHNVTNGGLISLIPNTGDIVAMVGSVDYNAPGFGNVNVTLSQLQPGSSFKPFAYATAFKKGWNGATTVVDEPVSFPNWDGTNYVPQNYDGKFHGTVSLRRALDNSFNIPAIKVLQYAGIHDTIQTAHDLGITSLNDESRYGLSLVLGGGEVRPIDMATAYATFDNGGAKVLPRAILSVKDRHGQDITKPTDAKPQPVLDPRIAYMITSILTDDSSRAPEFPLNGPLKLSRPAAAKTGTTNDFRDNWTVGYTPQLVTAVWVGNNDHSAMENVDGITGAAPIWHDYMEAALVGSPVLSFIQPAGMATASVCGVNEVFLAETPVPTRCSLFNITDDPGRDKKDKHTDDQPINTVNTDSSPPSSDLPPTPIPTKPPRTPRLPAL
jgi:1A family penicillin-binding protein